MDDSDSEDKAVQQIFETVFIFRFSGSPSFIFKQPFVPISSPVSPGKTWIF